MKSVERATRGYLRTLPGDLGSGPLARAVIGIARALDDEPADTARVLLVRELRMCLADLRGQIRTDGVDDVESFLASVSAEAFDAGH